MMLLAMKTRDQRLIRFDPSIVTVQQNTDKQFTKEIEENGKIPFLDCLVTRDNNKLTTTIYRKPTNTDRLLDQSSYNPNVLL